MSPLARIAGHVCIDVIPELPSGLPSPGGLAEAGTVEFRLGGCVGNTGAALAALGASVELFALLGNDLLGDAAAELLEAAGAGQAKVRRTTDAATSYSIVLQPPAADRAFLHHVGANAHFGGDQVPVDGADLLHVGYPQLLPALLGRGGAGLGALLGRARRRGVTTSVDFATVDPAHAADHPWPELLATWAPDVDVLSPSVDDLRPAIRHLPGRPGAGARAAEREAAIRCADELVRIGVAVALVTAGPDGMCLRTATVQRLRRGGAVLAALGDRWADRQLWAPPATAAATPTTRTTGAGDTATAGLLFGLLARLSPARTLRLAAVAAALHVGGAGRLPAWHGDRSPYDITLDPAEIDGWARDRRGLLHGPADREGCP